MLEKFVNLLAKAPEGSELKAIYQFMSDRMIKLEEENSKLKEQLAKMKEEKKAAK